MAAAEGDDMSDDIAMSEDAESDKSESTTESVDNTAEIECEDARGSAWVLAYLSVLASSVSEAKTVLTDLFNMILFLCYRNGQILPGNCCCHVESIP